MTTIIMMVKLMAALVLCTLLGHHTCTISQPTQIILHYVSNMEFNHTTLFASTMASTHTHFLLYRYLVQGQCAFIYTCVGGMQTAIIN